jgi:hypothetical protein
MCIPPESVPKLSKIAWLAFNRKAECLGKLIGNPKRISHDVSQIPIWSSLFYVPAENLNDLILYF